MCGTIQSPDSIILTLSYQGITGIGNAHSQGTAETAYINRVHNSPVYNSISEVQYTSIIEL